MPENPKKWVNDWTLGWFLAAILMLIIYAYVYFKITGEAPSFSRYNRNPNFGGVGFFMLMIPFMIIKSIVQNSNLKTLIERTIKYFFTLE